MQSFVIVATKGRARTVRALLDSLADQSAPPRRIIVIGTCEDDVEGLDNHPLTQAGTVRIHVSAQPGSSHQRNVGIDDIFVNEVLDDEIQTMIAFFDDDFRPADDWLAQCAIAFEDQTCVGVTGMVLADGVNGAAISEADAVRYIAGELPRRRHWAGAPQILDVTSLYGCNMAFRASALRDSRFDEALPLYGWLEDRDLSGMVRKIGRTIYSPLPRGVHLGVKSARTSGVRFGYSQVANPIYLWRKGTVEAPVMRRFFFTALAANIVRSVLRDSRADYYGRLKGNIRAISDLLRGRCAPQRVVELA